MENSSFTYLEAKCCGRCRAWGTFTAVVINCLSCLDKSSARVPAGLLASADALRNRHQSSLLRRFTRSLLRLFPHMRNFDPLQYRFDAFIYLAQRFADIAAVGLVALPAD